MAPMAKGNAIPLSARLARWRAWVQGTFLLIWLDPLALRMHTVCSPVLHCYSCPLALFACPIGVLANFSALHLLPFVALGTLAAIGALFGSFVCGWACPFGFLQDLIGKVPTRKFQLPAWMGYSRYAVLLFLVLLIPYFFGDEHPLFFCRVCPAGALEAALPHAASTALAGSGIAWPSATKMIVLGVFLVAMIFTWRPWCTLFCPLGAIYSLCNRVSFLYLRFHPERCNDCDLCRRLCRYHSRSERRSDDADCIRCLDCTRCTAVTVSHVFQVQPPDAAETASKPQAGRSSRPAKSVMRKEV
jgi:ferredoxin-type protein NapH